MLRIALLSGVCWGLPDMLHTPSRRTVPLIIVSGLSGAGKSSVLRVFEDLRYFTVDGMPAELASQLLSVLTPEALEMHRGIVLGMDLRQHDFPNQFAAAVATLKDMGFAPSILFLEARADIIVRRYKETRRPHPMERSDYGLEQAMDEEKRLLTPVREQADLVLDTSEYSIHDVRRAIQQQWTDINSNRRGLRVHLLTFGFKYGMPAESDMVFDLRFLPNPYHDPELRPLSGKDAAIAEYVLGSPVGKGYLEHLQSFLQFVLTEMEAEGRYRVTLAIGCTGGRHRSVATAEALYSSLKAADFAVSVEHRHMELG